MIDFVFIGIILISTIFALRKGLMRELISLAALVAGFFLAAFYYPAAARLFQDLTRTEAVANLIGFLVIFLSVILAGALAAFLVNRIIKMAAIQWVDRLLGAIFGFLRGAAIASILALALIAFPIREGTMARSVCAPYLLAGARAAVLLVPQKLKIQFNEQYKKILQNWNRNGSSS